MSRRPDIHFRWKVVCFVSNSVRMAVFNEREYVCVTNYKAHTHIFQIENLILNHFYFYFVRIYFSTHLLYSLRIELIWMDKETKNNEKVEFVVAKLMLLSGRVPII